MAGYEKRNDRVIDQAFKDLVRTEEDVIIRGMSRLLSDAMMYALGSHDEGHRQHIEIGDTYGWALVHDGKIEILNVNGRTSTVGRTAGKVKDVFMDWVNQGYDALDNPNARNPKVRIGHAERSLRDLAAQAPQGWSGILMAGMEASHTWFSVQYETDILQRTAGDIESKFHSYFKPVKH